MWGVVPESTHPGVSCFPLPPPPLKSKAPRLGRRTVEPVAVLAGCGSRWHGAHTLAFQVLFVLRRLRCVFLSDWTLSTGWGPCCALACARRDPYCAGARGAQCKDERYGTARLGCLGRVVTPHRSASLGVSRLRLFPQ